MAFTESSAALYARLNAPGSRRKPGAKAHEMNATEAKYAAHLDLLQRAGGVRYYLFEGVKLKLAAGTHYIPDFLVQYQHGPVELHDVKGFWKSTQKPHWEDDARVKIKVAADKFPCFKFVGVHFEKGCWEREEF